MARRPSCSWPPTRPSVSACHRSRAYARTPRRASSRPSWGQPDGQLVARRRRRDAERSRRRRWKAHAGRACGPPRHVGGRGALDRHDACRAGVRVDHRGGAGAAAQSGPRRLPSHQESHMTRRTWWQLTFVLIGCALVVGPATGVAIAQDKPADTMDVLREKVRADKKLLVATALELSESEAKSFWPL